jgi:hypothetical protein
MTTNFQDDAACHPHPAQNQPDHIEVPHGSVIPQFLQIPAEPDTRGTKPPITPWEKTIGLEVEVHGLTGLYRRGIVDAATADGGIVWIAQCGAQERKLIDKHDGYKVYLAMEELNHTPT